VATAARVTLLALLLGLFLHADYVFDDQILSPKATETIQKIAQEMSARTGINGYVVTTTRTIGRGESLYAFLDHYKSNLSKPYVVLMFVPNSKRIGILVSDPSLKTYYDDGRVKEYAIRIIGSPDKNSLQSKYDVGVVQAFSELADEIAEHKGIVLEQTIKDEGSWVVKLVTWMVYIGSLLVFWVYFGRPLYKRIRYGKQDR
jgi:hypothetical protein